MNALRPQFGVLAGALLIVTLAPGAVARGQIVGSSERPSLNRASVLTKGLAIEENLGESLPLDASFVASDGKQVTLGELFDGSGPVVLNFAYHSCPVMCSTVLEQTIESLGEQKWNVGREYSVVSISIDPKDTPKSAAGKKSQAIEMYGRGGEAGWHFLTGDESQIERVARAAGFPYRWDPVDQQYVHPGAMIIVTPKGRIARYLIGIDYDQKDVRLGLLEAAEEKTLDTVETLLLFCYRYDHEARGYVLFAENFMRIGGALVALALLGALFLLWRREFRRRVQRSAVDRPIAIGGSSPTIGESKVVHP